MVEVFNVDYFDKSGKDPRKPFQCEAMVDLVCGNGQRMKARKLNLYINTDVKRTRGFHGDSFGQNLKSFVYLSDVRSLDEEPYCYVQGTHLKNAMSTANLAIPKVCVFGAEAPLVDVVAIITVLGRAGSLIVSDQSGVHRGIPQTVGAEPRVLVMRYLPAKDL